MCNWSLLSDKILNKIFVYLQTDDELLPKNTHIAQCALTCREWRITAQSIVFSHVNLNSLQEVGKMQRIILVNTKIRYWVKCLDISFIVDNINVLPVIDSLFPKLVELNMDFSLPATYVLFGKMLIEQNKFRNLKVIPQSSVGQQDDVYVQCLDYLKKRVTRINLWEDDYQERNSYLTFKDKLDQFSSLEKIEFNAYTEIKSQSITGYIDSLTNRSPATLSQILIRIYDSKKISFSPRIPTVIQPANNLRKFHLEIEPTGYFSALKDQFLVYLIKKFPNLYSFKFTNVIRRTSTFIDFGEYYYPYYSTDESHSIDVVQQFLAYLCNRPVCAIENVIISNDNTSKIIRNLYTVVDVPSVPVSAHCLQIKQGVSGSFEDRNSIEAYVNLKSEYLKTRMIQVVCYGRDDTFYKQQFELIEEVEDFFDTMCLQVTNNVEFAYLLDHITKYCTNVKDLAISKEALMGNLFEKQEKVSGEGLGITRLIIKEFTPSLDQFPYISLCFPYLKSLVLYDCFEQLNQNQEPSFSLYMPDSTLTSLKIVIPHLDMSLDPIFIKVTTEISEPRYCYFIRMANGGKPALPRYKGTEYKLTEAGYRKSILDKGVTTCHIHCKSVEKLTVEQDGSFGFMLDSEVFLTI